MKMTEIEVQQLAGKALRRPLSKEEATALESYFSAHPEAKSDWRDSMRLNDGLRRLPELQPSSNFTNLVLQQVRRPLPREERRSTTTWLGRWRLSQGIAFVTLFLGVGTLFYHQHRVAERAEVARTLAAVSDVTMLFNSTRPTPAVAGANPPAPSVQTLQDFDAIRSLRAVPIDLDLGLLKALE